MQVEGVSIFFSYRQLPYADTPNLYVEAGPVYVAQHGLSALYTLMWEMMVQPAFSLLLVTAAQCTFGADVRSPRPLSRSHDFLIKKQNSPPNRPRVEGVGRSFIFPLW